MCLSRAGNTLLVCRCYPRMGGVSRPVADALDSRPIFQSMSTSLLTQLWIIAFIVEADISCVLKTYWSIHVDASLRLSRLH